MVWEEYSLDAVRPRLLAPLANRPHAHYSLEWLRAGGVGPVTLCLNLSSSEFRAKLGDGSDCGVDLYYFEDRMPRGPAGCARDAASLHPASEYVVVEGSIIPTVALAEVLDHHRQTGADATMVVDGAGDDGSSRPVGIYVFNRRALHLVPPNGYFDIKEMLVPELHRKELSVGIVHLPARCPRVDSLESYLVAQDWMLEQLRKSDEPPAGYRRCGATLLHAGARIAPTARILGAVMIGPGAVIEEHALLLGPTVIGPGSHIGAGAVIGRSTVWENASIGPGVRLEQCLVTAGVEVPAGVVRVGAFVRAGRAA